MLTVKQVAEQFNVQPWAVYHWIRQRKIPFFILPNGRYRFDEGEIAAFKETLRPGPVEPSQAPVVGCDDIEGYLMKIAREELGR